MLSALHAKVGGSTSSSPDPYSGLQNPRIALRCSHITASISSLPVKDLHQFFPHLLSNIFGFDQSDGWGLRLFNKTQHGDFHQLLQFLSPHGELFTLIDKLEAEGFIYEFPFECLPRPSQRALTEGTIPAFYSDKVQLSFSVDDSPTHIHLSAFEYFIFHFAYFLVYSQTYPSRSTPPQIFTDTLFVALFDSYLCHFLPFTGTVPPSLTSSLSQGHQYSSPPQLNRPFGSSMGQSSPYRVTNLLRGGVKVCVGSPSQVTRSETFVQVLVEFWLNQNSYNGGRGDLLAQAQNQFTPSEEHMILLRRLLKQIHYFSSGQSYTSPTTHSLLVPVTDTLRSSLLPVYIQKRLFYFLNYSFKHSPLDLNFRYILELWLTFIQPWRYTDPAKTSTQNKENFGTLFKRWRAFVLDNLPFYTSLLVEFLGRCFLVDLTQDPIVTLLFRTSKVFAQTELIGFIRQGEELLLSSVNNSFMGNSPLSSSSSIKAVFEDCVGPTSNTSPLFSQDSQEAIHSLLYKVCRAKALLTSQTPSQSSQPSIAQMPSESFVSLAAANPQPTKKSMLKWVWNSLGDLFSEDYHAPSGPSPLVTDPQKLITMLDTVAQNLSDTFQLPIPEVANLDSTVLGGEISFDASFIGHTHTIYSPPSLEPEFIQGSSRLSPQGKQQVIQGLRKCSGWKVHYLGDPLLQPIRSYENATLVRMLYRGSSFLNEKYSVQLAAVGNGDSLLHKLLLQLLSPPLPRPYTTATQQDGLEPPVTPVHRVTPLISYPEEEEPILRIPRINLRPFGSYYTLTYIFLTLLFIWLFSVPSLFCILALLCSVLVYCVASYCIHGTAKMKDR